MILGEPVPTFPDHALGLIVELQEIVLGQAKAVAGGFFPRGDLMVIFWLALTVLSPIIY